MTLGFLELVGGYVLSSGLAASHQEEMIHPQRCWIWHRHSCIEDHGERNPPYIDRFPKADPLSRLIDQHVRQARAEEEKAKHGDKADEAEKIPVVATSDTVIQPDAVVVQIFHAVVTSSAVVTSGWPPDVTCPTVLNGNIHGTCHTRLLYHNPFGHWGPEIERIGRRVRLGHQVQITGQNLQHVSKSDHWRD